MIDQIYYKIEEDC